MKRELAPRQRASLDVFVIGLAYVVASKVALVLALPPGHAVPIWPPAGLALGTYLLVGNRALLAVFLASIVANLRHLSLDHFVIAVALAAGSTLQTWVVGRIVQRFCGRHPTLSTVREVGRFMVSCMVGTTIAATVAMATLHQGRGLSLELTLLNGFTWWIGDALGMITFAPLLLLFLGQPKDAWRPRRVTAGPTIVIGFAICLGAFFVVKKHEELALESTFHHEAEQLSRRVENALTTGLLRDPMPSWARRLEAGSTVTEAARVNGLAFRVLDAQRAVAAVSLSGVDRVAEIDLERFFTALEPPTPGVERTLRGWSATDADRAEVTAQGVFASHRFTVGDERFTLRVHTPTERLPQGLLSWMVLVLCIVVSATVGGLALVLSGRATRVEALVAERTVQLETARDDAQRASDAKTRFLATMSHELRTPLNGVLGTASLLADTSLTADQRKLVTVLNDSGQSLLALLNDVLDMSRIEAGRLELDHHRFAVREVLETAVELFRAPARKQGLELILTLDASLPCAVVGDALRLKQVLGNLVSNAVKFTERGTVTVRATWQDALVIEVIDTGCGIAPETAARLFQPFAQADSTTTRRFGGTGLGLAICRTLTEKMGGTLSLHSRPGHGSTFTLRLPLGVADALLAPVAARQVPEVPSSLRVLVAEDNPTNQLIVRRFLEQLGVTGTFVENGLRAVEEARRLPGFDVVLMDLHMPEMDGLEATRQIRALPLARQPMVFALTADAYAETKQTCTEAGMNGFLAKPLRKTALAEVLFTAEPAVVQPRSA